MIPFKEIKEIRDSAKARKESGLFLVEGIRMIREMPRESVRTILVSESFRKEGEALAEGIETCVVSDSRFLSLSDTRTPQGVMALVAQKDWEAGDIFRKEAPYLAVLCDLQDPGNVGTILRTALASGAGGVILCGTTVDVYHPKTVRGTMGAIFRIPFIRAEKEEVTDLCRTYQIPIYAACPGGDAIPYTDADVRNGAAFLIGNEGNGLSEEWIRCADRRVTIPMEDDAESLNAAIACGLLLYEARRRKGEKT